MNIYKKYEAFEIDYSAFTIGALYMIREYRTKDEILILLCCCTDINEDRDVVFTVIESIGDYYPYKIYRLSEVDRSLVINNVRIEEDAMRGCISLYEEKLIDNDLTEIMKQCRKEGVEDDDV